MLSVYATDHRLGADSARLREHKRNDEHRMKLSIRTKWASSTYHAVIGLFPLDFLNRLVRCNYAAVAAAVVAACSSSAVVAV